MPGFLGEIRMFAGTFAPVGWAFCAGQLQPISENEALFMLLGTTYGGDGQETYALPDLRGRVPIHQGTTFVMGEQGGTEEVTLTSQQIPIHTHPFVASTDAGTQASPIGFVPAASNVVKIYKASPAPNSPMAAQSTTPAGGSQPHENMQPYVAVSYIISLFGPFPSQN